MFTPGPWIIDGKRIRTKAIVFPGAERGATVAQIDKGAVGSEQARGNAQLIVTSPDLFVALKQLYDAIEPALTIPLATMTNEHLFQVNEKIVQAALLASRAIASVEQEA